ncbi:MAG: cytochrome P450, partial [Leptolyngbya sp. SIO3F4]|nr:cytochrome P450 [Leptolyngbya sp. SIO3F4]
MSLASIPQASTAPRWLQTLHYTANPLGYMDQGAKQNQDIFNAPVIGPHEKVLFVSHPDGIQQIFSSDSVKAPPNVLLQPVVGDYSIFSLEGIKHRRERKLLMPPFHREQIPRYGQLILELTENAMQGLSAGDTFLARSLMQTISLDVILKVVFGLSDGPRFDQLKLLIVQFTDCFQNILVSGALFFPALRIDWGPKSPWGYFQHVRNQVSELLFAEIAERRTQDTATRNDILSLLMEARDEAGQPMEDAELHDELLTMLLAGHETTASAISWALYWIHHEPQVYQTLVNEIESLGPSSDPVDITKLPYLTAVCNETLRLYPITNLTVPREATAPMTLMGYSVEPGTRLYGAIYLTHHRLELYPDSRTFRPERFLERQFSMYEFLPFGGGVRRCIGEVLAQFEMKLVLAHLTSHYQLEWADNTPEVPKRRGVTLAPGNGVKMLFKG